MANVSQKSNLIATEKIGNSPIPTNISTRQVFTIYYIKLFEYTHNDTHVGLVDG